VPPHRRNIGMVFQRYTLFPHMTVFHNVAFPLTVCKRNIEMTPLCKVEVTLPRVLGSREVRRGGGVDEQAGVQPS
jgi:ABC-type Fe3+/spermidine/putrescine transport system ATPase subunit